MSDKKSNPYANLNLREQIYMECRSMAEYALAQGKSVPATAIKNIEALEDHSAEDDASPQILRDLDITDLVETHSLLAKLIEPATPRTVLLLDREQETESLLKFLGPVQLIRQLMIAALISLVSFIGILSTPFINADNLSENVLAASGIDQLIRLLFYISAAGLGGSFAGLYKANAFISKGTYDPCHQGSYWIRFLLGIIAGLLLAILISEKSLGEDGMLSEGVIRPLLGILGGFSADLLYTFLSRMVETFKSLFEGSSQNILDAKAQEGKAKLAGMEVNNRMKLAQDLMQMQQKMGAEADPEQIKQQINDMMQGLMNK